MSWNQIQEELLSLKVIDECSCGEARVYGKLHFDLDTHALWGYLGAALIMAYTKKTL